MRLGDGPVPILGDGGEGGGAAGFLRGLSDGLYFGVGEVAVFFFEGGAGAGAGWVLACGEEPEEDGHAEMSDGIEKRWATGHANFAKWGERL